MDGYMQAAKKMLVLIDKFDKEDLTDDDKMRELDNKLREIYSNKKSLYAELCADYGGHAGYGRADKVAFL